MEEKKLELKGSNNHHTDMNNLYNFEIEVQQNMNKKVINFVLVKRVS